MRVIDGAEPQGDCRRGVVAIGNFDGVHRGHQAMLSRLGEYARAQGTHSVVLTFDPHPVSLLRPDQVPPRLCTLSRKLELFQRYGVDFAIVYPTDHAFLEQTPREFFEHIVCQKLDAVGLVEGPNFYFGKDRAGDVKMLGELCRGADVFLDVVEPARHGGEMISSSRVRRLIEAGELRLACELLGHPYLLEGTVVHGANRGGRLGFPTANLSEIPTVIPASGVYGGLVEHAGMVHPAAVHIGANPTFADDQSKVEAHLVGFSGDLYAERLHVDLLERIREVRKFDSPGALRAQLQRDVEQVQLLVSESARR
jgi:riboflavin kinase / FMN adenylyltransferase